MRINHNIQALNAYRQLSQNQNVVSKHLEKLSSGLRINRAADDAAGLAISEKMRSQIRGLAMAERNALDGISLIQTAEGAMNTVSSILQRMRELAVQGANGTNSIEDNREIQKEINQLIEAIDQTARDTEFNTKKILNGELALTYKIDSGVALSDTTYKYATNGTSFDVVDSAGGTGLTVSLNQDYPDLTAVINDVQRQLDDAKSAGKLKGTYTVSANSNNNGIIIVSTESFDIKNSTESGVADGTSAGPNGGAIIHIGANSGQSLVVDVNKLDSTQLGDLSAGKPLSSLYVNNVDNATNGGILTPSDANTAITVIQKAIDQVSSERARLGAYQNRLEHTINNLAQTQENLTAAESRIRDADLAMEMTNFTKNNIINQAAQAMLAQANQLPQGILQLLK